jgi:hypothetical protein
VGEPARSDRDATLAPVSPRSNTAARRRRNRERSLNAHAPQSTPGDDGSTYAVLESLHELQASIDELTLRIGHVEKALTGDTAEIPDPREVALHDALATLFDGSPPVFDVTFLRQLGREGGGAVQPGSPDGVAQLLGRLADKQRIVPRPMLALMHAAAALSDVSGDVPPPPRVRAMYDGQQGVVGTDAAVIIDAPDLLPLVGTRAVVPVALPLAWSLSRLLSVPLASRLARFRVVSTGVPRDDHVLHDELLVEDVSGETVRVPWRFADGKLHVDGVSIAFGLGRGRAWRDGEWSRRQSFTEELERPYATPELLAERDLDT